MPYAPVWPFSIGDYMQDTVTLSTEEHGAYLLLLMAQWSNGGEPLPNDPEVLARICRLTKRRWSQKVSPSVLRFFVETATGISHPRIAGDYRRVARKIETNRVNAARGGRAYSSRRNQMPTDDDHVGSASVALDVAEARDAAQIRRRIDDEIARRWPGDPTPFDSCVRDEDVADFARQGATVQIFDAVMTRVWPRLIRPPATLSQHRADVIAHVRRWIAYKRWIQGGRKHSSPWRVGWGSPPDPQALARFDIPASYRSAGECVGPTDTSSLKQEE